MPKEPTIAELQKAILFLSEKLIETHGALAEIKAAVNVLKMFVVSQLSPDNLGAGLEQFQILEKKLLESDAGEKERREVLEQIQALQEWVKQGRPPFHT